MAIRFIDTGFYKSPFVRGLQGACKGLYSFIICDCTPAGIWSKDLPIASEYIGVKISESDFEKGFIKTGKAIDLKNGKYFFPDFIEHQYPKGLQEKNPAHSNIILELKKYDLIDEKLKIKEGGLQRPFEGAYVMVKDKVTVKVKETVMVTPELIFPFDSKEFKNHWNVLCGQKKWKNKEFSALQASLKKLSNYSEETAIKIIEDCIAGGWQGLVTEKYDKILNYGNRKQNPIDLANEAIALSDRDREKRNAANV